MKENEINKSNKIKIIVITALIFLVSIAGISYAYFTIQVTGNEEASSIRVTAASLRLIYRDTLVMSATDVYPGWSQTKTISVENDGTDTVSYNIIWRDLLNGITNNELKISATCSSSSGTCSGINETIIPTYITETHNVKIKENISIAPGVTHTYTVTVSFPELSTAQDYNQGKTFRGTLNIEEYVEVPTDESYFTYIFSVPPSVTYDINMTTCVNYVMTEWEYTSQEAEDYCNNDANAEDTITIEQDLLDDYISSSEYANYGLSNVVFSGGEVTITDYNVSGGTDVIIPSTINGVPVTVIGGSAFYNKGLTSVVIPNGVRKIETITYSPSMCRPGSGAFSGNQLTSIVIPESVTEIYGGSETICYSGSNTEDMALNSGAFSDNQLTSVTIQGKSSSSDFTTYGTYIWGWATGYSDSNIVWTGSGS